MSADVLVWMIVAGIGLVWLGFWWMSHGPDKPPDDPRCGFWRIG